ncbi:Pentraxin fusion protein [Chelonia mydas]|uniref:Pentraxin fusion protein n=1 Tax=Chelonia mydas TaxID=8469 RepID=M7B5T5_CHEMY|nr:Pentraxin fusion protein [Chelonia mydas]
MGVTVKSWERGHCRERGWRGPVMERVTVASKWAIGYSKCPYRPGQSKSAWNLALRCPATQSSTYQNYGPEKAGAEKAVDGNHNGIWDNGSRTPTDCATEPRGGGGLGSPRSVSAVMVKNREDCCGERIKGAQIHVGDSKAGHGKDDPICGTITDTTPGSISTISCNGMEGRYVTITIPDRVESLTLCEVEVYGTPVGDC